MWIQTSEYKRHHHNLILAAKIQTRINKKSTESPSVVNTCTVHQSLVVFAAKLISAFHLEQVDAFTDQQIFGVAESVRRQETWPAENPGIVHVEDAEKVRAGVNHGHTGVVSG